MRATHALFIFLQRTSIQINPDKNLTFVSDQGESKYDQNIQNMTSAPTTVTLAA